MRAVILVIEDDQAIQEMLAFAFEREDWKLLMADSGETALRLLKCERVDCILLDLLLPGMDGLKTLKKIRAQERLRQTPVIIASAMGEDADIVAGLELGADDYVVKPYSPRVLIARIRAALRRLEDADEVALDGDTPLPVQRGSLRLDRARHEAFDGERLLVLSATEFDLLLHFLSHPDIVFTRSQLINAVHGDGYPVTDRSVDVQIVSLRRKLGERSGYIETIRGVGYRFRIPLAETR